MGAKRSVLGIFLLSFIWVNAQNVNGALTSNLLRKIAKANKEGPYLGLIIPNSFELDPLLQSSNYTSTNNTIDFAGRRFRFGAIGDKPVILVMTGLSMINAGITTQLLLSFFNIKGVVHYGIAGNANPSLNIGDVAIPQYWAHLALWNWQNWNLDRRFIYFLNYATIFDYEENMKDKIWRAIMQRYGQGPEDELPLEVNGDYTRKYGYLKFANYTTNVTEGSSHDNLLNNIWYQPEEIFPVDGTPEERQHAFWVPVDSEYFNISQKLEDIKLESCINSTTCLSTTPKVVRVQRGTSASFYLDNAAYSTFIHNKFNVSPVDMESASVALICHQQRVPFIAIRALSDLAGGGSAQSNEADTFSSLAALNSVTVVVEFVKHLSL